ncbi:hypothetical protein R3P38DRAFT_3325130 [Favolaschia claudopus]|uniref:Glycosyltransferase n=1 Tax=Favolaschia claudopus TaxID=2862362 RepID=A0AAW0AE95_9AGAR
MATKHIAALLIPAWGHTISYIHLATQLLDADPNLVITIVQHNIVVRKMLAELASHSHDQTRLRVLGVGQEDIDQNPTTETLIKVMQQLTMGWLENLDEFVKHDQAWPKPKSVHFDFGCGGLPMERAKAVLGPECKMLFWWSAPIIGLHSDFGHHDFAAITDAVWADEARREGRTYHELMQQVVTASNGTDKLCGRIQKYTETGGPDMYDYERQAYGSGPPFSAPVIVPAQKLAKAVDGFLVATSQSFEPVGVPFCRDFYGKRGQELFVVGMQAHELCWEDAVGVAPTDERVKSFLDEAVKEYGPKSVLFISFGSMAFPFTTPKHIEALVETLLSLDQPFPFLFALGSRIASLPAPLIERVNTSGKGMICDFWVEQRAILQHGSVGWFLSHGGFNSVAESLTQGIPLILWPVSAEVPSAAMMSAEPNPVAIELFQIRTGPQLGPSLRTDVKITGTVEDAILEFKKTFELARGPQGAIIKANAKKMAKKLREERLRDAPKELKRLIDF